jgi:hypothetical protein
MAASLLWAEGLEALGYKCELTSYLLKQVTLPAAQMAGPLLIAVLYLAVVGEVWVVIELGAPARSRGQAAAPPRGGATLAVLPCHRSFRAHVYSGGWGVFGRCPG